MLTKIEQQRMLNAQSTTRETNCMGTVLYVFRTIPNDSYVGPDEKRWKNRMVDNFVEKLEEIPQNDIKPGSIMVIRNRYCGKDVIHMGIISSVNPPKVYHRNGINKGKDTDGKIYPEDDLGEVLEEWGGLGNIQEFYKRPMRKGK